MPGHDQEQLVGCPHHQQGAADDHATAEQPNPADPLVKPIAHEMMNSPETYFKTAQEWTKKYASPELVEAK